jgi:hypothetical protein
MSTGSIPVPPTPIGCVRSRCQSAHFARTVFPKKSSMVMGTPELFGSCITDSKLSVKFVTALL